MKPPKYPVVGDKQIKEKFAWLPVQIGVVRIWGKKYRVHREYKSYRDETGTYNAWQTVQVEESS